MARENAVLCPHCNRGPFVDLLQHAAIYGRRAHDADHLELALRLARDEKAAKSAIMAQFSKEVSHDDGDGNQTGDGGGAEEGVRQDGEGDGGTGEGAAESVGTGADRRDGPDPLAEFLNR